ncbi:MAG: AAA family ATPase [Clostridia bacterium]|nr:AAA family ATPase [Clostridia bacterium]
MEQITAMKITGITLNNFRNHTETTHFDFGDISYITGHNGTGKTTMAHAVCFVLYGVTYYGEQKIERLMNENADNVQVQLHFIDQNGAAHTLMRTRKNEKYSVLMDGYTVNQSRIEQMFGDKNTFLAMFNPTYLIENMGNDGRELILRHLKPVSQKDVLAAIPTYQTHLENIDLETQSPEEALKDTRAAIRRVEQQLDVLQGHIESIEESQKTADVKLGELYSEKRSVEEQIKALKEKQFEGIDTEDFAIQRDVLTRKLSNNAGENPAVTTAKEKLAEVKARVYSSKFTQAIAEASAEYNSLAKQYNELKERITALKVGDVCPTCKMQVTETNIEEIRNHLIAECSRIGELGKGVVARGKEIAELDKKAKAQFEQWKADDIAKFTAELEELQNKTERVDVSEIRSKLDELADLEKYGNLSEQELSELGDLEATLIGINAQIETVEQSASEERLKSALVEKDVFIEQMKKYKDIVTALTEYIFKRADLATAELKMPNVEIRLFEVIRGTGEVKNAFKFDYKGREYTTLSLSEKTLAGIEISALIRRITGKDYPVCIDNTESIAAFNDVDMPSQVMLIRVVKGQPLTVKFQNNYTAAVPAENEMRKAA